MTAPSSSFGAIPDLHSGSRVEDGCSVEWRSFAQLSALRLYELLRFRQAIFVVEQRSPYPDLDGLDAGAAHLVLREEGVIAGYLRVVRSPGKMRIGRVAVRAELRRRGLGRRLMAEGLDFCGRRQPGSPVLLTAQHHLVRFYESFGFWATSEPFDDFGLPHIDMLKPPQQRG